MAITGNSGIEPWFRKKRFLILVLLLILGLIGSFSGKSDSNGNSGAIKSRSYPVSFVRSAEVNPATLSVVFKVTNDGTQSVMPKCTVTMQDASGTYKGWDVFDITDPIEPNVTKQIIVQLTITKQGAAFANQFSGDCVASTSDTGTNIGKEVVISDIQNFSATDGSEGWYWGASFKANQKPMTQMNCEVKALDKNGKIIGETTYRANTLNDGTVIGYGSDAKSLVDSTKSMVLSINSFDIKCTL